MNFLLKNEIKQVIQKKYRFFRFIRKRILNYLFILIFLFEIVFIIYLNPRDIFTERSSGFSFTAFRSLKEGSHIRDVINRLGSPIEIIECDNSSGNKGYMFMGNFPHWVISGTECWIIVDKNGFVLKKLIRENYNLIY